MSDSDDDRPLMDLIKKRKALTQANTSTEKKIKTEPATSSSSSSAKPKVKVESKSSSKPSSSSSGASRKSAEYYETTKGDMVQKLLVRWWYAIEWPKAEDISDTPPGYESLDGFPGVFISTRSDSLGTILDLRDKSTCPSFKNLTAWTSETLKNTLIKAYENQMEVLKEHEGEDNNLYRTLRTELKDVRKVNVDQADREAKKFKF